MGYWATATPKRRSRQALATLIAASAAFAPAATFFGGHASAAAGAVTGEVFRDSNWNGTLDTGGSTAEAGISGVTVRAYDDSNALIGSAVTGSTGAWSINVPGPARFEVDATTLPFGMYQGISGTPFTFYADGGSTGNNVPAVYPAEYPAGGPAITAPTATNPLGADGVEWDSSFGVTTQWGSYTNSKKTVREYGANATGITAPTATACTNGQVGTTFGLAYSPAGDIIQGAWVKRHTPLGPTGSMTSLYKNCLPWVDLAGAAGTADPHTAPSEQDTGAISHIGRDGVGGIDIGSDALGVYAVNMTSDSLAYVPFSAASYTPGASNNWTVPNHCGASARQAAGLTVKDGYVYVASTCEDGSRYYVDQFSEATHTWTPTPALSGIVNPGVRYTMNAFDADLGAVWGNGNCSPLGDGVDIDYKAVAWSDTNWLAISTLDPGCRPAVMNNQLLMTDIDFASNGDMIVAARDRVGDMWAEGQQWAWQIGYTGYTSAWAPTVGGDIIRATKTAPASWAADANSQVPTEQFVDNATTYAGSNAPFGHTAPFGATHAEPGVGAVLVSPGTGRIIATQFDPIDCQFGDVTSCGALPAGQYSPLLAGLYEQGVRYYPAAGGKATDALSVVVNGRSYTGPDATADSGSGISFAKGNGLGDLAVRPGIAPVSIGNQVFIDVNKNGIQDPSDTLVSGATVNLLDSTGTVVATTTTDAQGRYLFWTAGIAGVKYATQIPKTDMAAGGVLAGMSVATANNSINDENDFDATLDGSGNATTPQVTIVGPGQSIRHLDFGFQPATLSVGDLVWIDTNRDGVFNGTEVGINGVKVELLTAAGAAANDANGNPVPAVLTDTNGRYSFTNLNPGSYKARFTLPSGYMWTGTLAGGNTSLDSNAAYTTALDATATTATFTLSSTAVVDGDSNTNHRLVTDPTIDAGIMLAPVSIGDYTWNDLDRDGQQDSGEPAIGGVTVTLYESDGVTPAKDIAGNTVAAATTNGSGFYSFKDLPAGHQYVIKFSMPATGTWTRTTATAGVPATDSNANAATGFTATFTTPASGTNSVVTPDDPTIDAGYYQQVSIGDYAWIDVNRDGQQTAGEPILSGVAVTLKDSGGATVATTTTNGVGFYSFAGLYPSTSYTVTFTAPTGYSFTGQDSGADATDSDADQTTGVVAVTTPASGVNSAVTPDDPTIDAGFVKLDLTITKTLTSASQAFPGDTVTFTITPHNNGPVNAITGWKVTDVLPSGLTLVSMTGSGYTCAGTVCTATSGLAAGADGPVITVTATMNAGVVTVQRNITYITPAAGEIVETNTLTVPAAGVDTTTTATNNDAHADVNPAPLLSVGDLVWTDLNQNGQYDNGETGLAGVTVTLLDSTGAPAKDAAGATVAATATDANGRYQFSGLNPGDYQVRFTLPSGHYWTVTDVAGGNDSLDNDAAYSAVTDATATTATFTLTSTAVVDGDTDTNHRAVTNPTIDAGVIPYVSIGDYVWLDINRDGIQNAGEPAVKDVTVTLTGPEGVSSTITDVNGFYSFTGLTPNTDYTVTFTAPTGYSFTLQNSGAATADSNADPSNGQASVTSPNDGKNLAATPDDPTIDAGLIAVDLTVTKTLDTAGTVYPGNTVTFTLTPHNNGPADALAGWKVTDILPAGLTFVSMNGAGYTCTGADCTDNTGVNLAAGADGAPITVTATVDANATPAGTTVTLHNVTYISPAPTEIVEGNPLAVPSTTTDTDGTSTNNDDQADVTVTPLASIGNYVWEDLNANGIQDASEPGVQDVVVHLYDATGTEIASTTTDPTGLYSFTGLIPGDYHVAIEPPVGYLITLQDQGGDDAVDSDAYTSGLMDTTTLTPGENDPTWDAGLVLPAALGDYVWIDANRDGVQDAGETPLADVAVHLSGTDMFGNSVSSDATTDVNGLYLFDGLAPGTYQVTFTPPAGWYVTDMNQGGDTESDSDADPVTGSTVDIVLGSGQTDLTWDAGVYSLVSIGDYTWIDVNRNGQQDSGEPALAGVQVTLVDGEGTQIAATTTNTAGFYSFTGLTPNTNYTVLFDTPAGYSPTIQLSGPYATDSDATFLAIITPASGLNSATTPDDPTIDAGYIAIDLTVTKTFQSGKAQAGETISYSLVPHNAGPAAALPGWSVTDVPPAELTIIAMTGTGYTCDLATLTCTDVTGNMLAAGADGAPITVTAVLAKNLVENTVVRNVAFISPADIDIVESNVLVVPNNGTDTSTSPTNNDSEAPLTIVKPPVTGADSGSILLIAGLLGAAGFGLVMFGRRRRANV